MSQVENLVAQLKALVENPPENAADRRALLPILRKAHFAVEEPLDTAHRFGFAGLDTAIVRTGINLKLFDVLAAAPKGITLDEVAAKTGAKPLLLRRMLRFLSCHGVVSEPTPCTYFPTRTTEFLTQRGAQACIEMNGDVLQAAFRCLPPFLRQHGYNDMTDIRDTPFQVAWKTNKTPYEMRDENLTDPNDLNHWMSWRLEISPSWLDNFPHELLLADPDSEKPLFLDVGGGLGWQCHALKQRLPQIKRKVMVQDIEQVIANRTPGVDGAVINFFEPNPVKGASFYYLKSVLHDHPDYRCAQILKNQIAAMEPHSRIIIDDIVLPENNPSWLSVDLDMAYMATLASMERTELQWKELFASVGLVTEKVYRYDEAMMTSTMILKQA